MGFSVNEPVNYAVRAAVEQGVIELIYEGERKKLWKFKLPVSKKENNNNNKNTTPEVHESITSE